jgi:DNA-binding phage protein
MAQKKTFSESIDRALERVPREGLLISHDKFETELFREDPEFAMDCIVDEFREYVKTGDPLYLRKTLGKVLESLGYPAVAKMTGMSEKILHSIAGGKTKPDIVNFFRCLETMGYEMELRKVSTE